MYRKHGISSATLYMWKKYGDMHVSQARKLMVLEENGRLEAQTADDVPGTE